MLGARRSRRALARGAAAGGAAASEYCAARTFGRFFGPPKLGSAASALRSSPTSAADERNKRAFGTVYGSPFGSPRPFGSSPPSLPSISTDPEHPAIAAAATTAIHACRRVDELM